MPQSPPDQNISTGSPGAETLIESTISPDTPDTLDGLEKRVQPYPHVSPNGLDANGLELAIQMFAAANPKWGTSRIAKKFGQPREVVARILGRDQ
jgi:hypothetical protein